MLCCRATLCISDTFVGGVDDKAELQKDMLAKLSLVLAMCVRYKVEQVKVRDEDTVILAAVSAGQKRSTRQTAVNNLLFALLGTLCEWALLCRPGALLQLLFFLVCMSSIQVF